MTRTIGMASSMGRIVNQENSGTEAVGEGVGVGEGVEVGVIERMSTEINTGEKV
jgi:hypothetical protein